MNMNTYLPRIKSLIRTLPSALLAMSVAHSAATAGTIAQTPLFLTKGAKPMVMLVMSKDHQLFYKAYNDYSDLDGDGDIERTYKHSFTYYGYFDSKTCYGYSGGKFTPVSPVNNNDDEGGDEEAANAYCDGTKWSGNFLNWVTMSRMDIVRKLLYGGQRSTDTDAVTVLERAYLPTDAHSWVKYYNGNDTNKLTPFSPPIGTGQGDGVSFCNTTHAASSKKSQTALTEPPLMMVAKGNYSLWTANERWQCYWSGTGSGEKNTSNGNVPSISGLSAHSANPPRSVGLGEYVVRVEVCGSTSYGGDDKTCSPYPDGNRKPVGLLQGYADSIQFGLITGSYNKNISGGVLRKNIGNLTDESNPSNGEINPNNGTFTSTSGIVSTINKLRMYGYRYTDGTDEGGTYIGSAGDNCTFQLTDITEGNCTSWGNPISEMFLEALRYYAGASAPTPDFNPGTDRLGLSTATWPTTSQNPLNQSNACAVLNTVVFNASVSSYDGDATAGGFSSVAGGGSLDSLVNNIGNKEGIAGQRAFIGKSDAGGSNLLCTGKTINNLSSAEGICPEAPTLEGTYDIAGLAQYAHTRDLRTGLTGDQTVKTFGVALSPAVPRINVPVGNRIVTILPAYILNHPDRGRGAGTLVDFKVVERTDGYGKFYVSWEDSEQGGDYDQDIWGLIEYRVDGSKVRVTTDAIAESTNNPQGFGYIISGTTQDGFHAHSGIEGFNYIDPTLVPSCSNCQVGNGATSHEYNVGTGSAKLIEQPLYYAAKWGGFEEDDDNPGTVGEPDDASSGLASEWDADGDNQPDNYFFVTDPTQLVASLEKVFSEVEEKKTSASAVAANSTGLQTDTLIFQAQFDSTVWKGDLVALPINTTNGSVGEAKWKAAEKLDGKVPNNRVILTLNPADDQGIPFRWFSPNLPGPLKTLLNINPANGAADARGEDRLNFLRGDRSKELQKGGDFRDRDSVLGDIINSAPVYVAEIPPFNYPNSLETGESYADFVADIKTANRPAMVYVGANDGMLHGFDTETGEERLAYVPNRIFANLNRLTDPDYNDPGEHRYYVDGPPTVGDVFFDGAWHTVLVGALGAGGRGLFALDVTNPAGFSENSAADTVMWEFTDADDPSLGYTIGQPSIVKMQNGEWAAIVGNGYKNTGDNGNRRAALFIIPLDNPAEYVKIDTGVGGGKRSKKPNGLATPAAVDYNGDNKVDFVYAGDLLGNLWKFDVSDADPDKWNVAFENDKGNPAPLFKASQPITVQPEVGRHLDGQPGFMVYFGTGKYFETSDNATTSLQAFYGIWDHNDGTRVTSSGGLVEQEVIQVVSESGSEFRIVSDNPVDWSSKKGWYMELPTSGERVVADPILSNGRIIFVTAIPSQSQALCDSGGSGWIMELDANNGGRIEQFTFDVDNDGDFDADDLLNAGDLNGDGNSDNVAPGGRKSSTGIIQRPTIIGKPGSDIEYKYSSGSEDAGIEAVREHKGGGIRGRVSWEQLR